MNAVKYLRAALELQRIEHPCNGPGQLTHQQFSERSADAMASQSLGYGGREFVSYGLVQSHS